MSNAYQQAGVDTEAAHRLNTQMRRLARKTHTPAVLPDLGAYAGLFSLHGLSDGTAAPILASSCDGVGSKVLLAQMMESYQGLGQDLVAMNVNDLLPVGAKPLFFLNCIASHRLNEPLMLQLIESMSQACCVCQTALLGGETAVMPDLYAPEHFDLTGFAVGLVDAKRVPQPEILQAGDVVLGAPASGLHANGFTLVKKILQSSHLWDRQRLSRPHPAIPDAPSLAAALLEPTALYVNDWLAWPQDIVIKCAAHITGGGLYHRTRRLLPADLQIQIDRQALPRLAVLELLAHLGHLSWQDLSETFNMGIGYVCIVDAHAAAQIAADPSSPFYPIGQLRAGQPEVVFA